MANIPISTPLSFNTAQAICAAYAWMAVMIPPWFGGLSTSGKIEDALLHANI